MTLPEYLLLLYLFATAVGGYLVLRHLIHHRERFAFLQRDAAGGLRETELFNRCAEGIDRILSWL